MIPILVIAFNRPEHLKKTLKALKKNQAFQTVYLSIDGPRVNNSEDILKIKKVKNIFEEEMFGYHYSIKENKVNLGCKLAVVEAINWFFQNEDSGLILEDDVLLHHQAVELSELALRAYRDIAKVGSISLHCDYFGNAGLESIDAFFTKFPNIWGWATWRDRWIKYDAQLNDFEKQLDLVQIERDVGSSVRAYWETKFTLYKDNKIDTWDFAWLYTHWKYGWISLQFKENLSENIGFGTESTNTTNYKKSIEVTKLRLNPNALRLPKQLKHDRRIDNWLYRNKLGIFPTKIQNNIIKLLLLIKRKLVLIKSKVWH